MDAPSSTFVSDQGVPHAFLAADVDGDGCGELAVELLGVDGTPDRISMLRGFPDPAPEIPSDGLATDEQPLVAGDLLPAPGDELVTGHHFPRPHFSVLVAGAEGPPQPSGFTFAVDLVEGRGRYWWTEPVAIGDLDGDGAPDLALGVPGTVDRREAGRVFVFRGPLDPVPHGPDDADLVVTGPTRGDDLFGAALAAADVDGDGRDDLVVGAELDDTGAHDAGAVSLYLGADLFP